jgi:hypothetical protein
VDGEEPGKLRHAGYRQRGRLQAFEQESQSHGGQIHRRGIGLRGWFRRTALANLMLDVSR